MIPKQLGDLKAYLEQHDNVTNIEYKNGDNGGVVIMFRTPLAGIDLKELYEKTDGRVVDVFHSPTEDKLVMVVDNG